MIAYVAIRYKKNQRCLSSKRGGIIHKSVPKSWKMNICFIFGFSENLGSGTHREKEKWKEEEGERERERGN